MTKRTKEEVYKDLEGIFEVKKLEDYCEQIDLYENLSINIKNPPEIKIYLYFKIIK